MTREEARRFLLQLSEDLWLTDDVRSTLQDIAQRIVIDSFNVGDNGDPPLSAGDPKNCLGNGEHGFECCCDACDHYFTCFPEQRGTALR